MAKPTTRILLVEDNSDLRQATADLLAALGYELVVVSEASQALERRQEIDLLVANAYPEGMPGLDLVDRLRRSAPGLPVVLLSGFGDDPELRRRVLAGDVGLLQVPFAAEALAEAVETALAEQRPAPGLAPDGLAERRRSRRAPRARTGWRLAAAVLVTAGLAFVIRPGGAVAPELPAPQVETARRGATIEVAAPLGDLPRAPDAFAWRRVTAAAFYRLALRSVDDELLWDEDSVSPPALLPDEIRERLQPSVTYFWTVEAFAADRALLARSPRSAFRIDPDAVTATMRTRP